MVQVILLLVFLVLVVITSLFAHWKYVKECNEMTVEKFVGKCVELGKNNKMSELESFVKRHVAFFMLNQKKIQAKLEELGENSIKGVS